MCFTSFSIFHSHSHSACVMGMKLACVMTLWDIGKQCIPIPEPPLYGVHPAPKHTYDAHNPSCIKGKHQVVSPVNRSQDCTMELSRDSPQRPDVEFVCETLGPVTETLNQRLPLKQIVVMQTDST